MNLNRWIIWSSIAIFTLLIPSVGKSRTTQSLLKHFQCLKCSCVILPRLLQQVYSQTILSYSECQFFKISFHKVYLSIKKLITFACFIVFYFLKVFLRAGNSLMKYWQSFKSRIGLAPKGRCCVMSTVPLFLPAVSFLFISLFLLLWLRIEASVWNRCEESGLRSTFPTLEQMLSSYPQECNAGYSFVQCSLTVFCDFGSCLDFWHSHI